MIIEEWKSVKGYEGFYEVSNLGRIKSIEKYVKNRYNTLSLKKEKILNPRLSCGYYGISLCKNGIVKTRNIHQLVSESFFNHKPNGYKLVVNHINHIRTDNRLENLEIVTTRENTTLSHIESSSQYVGVSWNKLAKKYTSSIRINGIKKHLGYFINELEASNAYNLKLKTL